VLDAPAVDRITDIVPRLCGADGKGIVVAGRRGAICVSRGGAVGRTVVFAGGGANPAPDAAALDVDGDGRAEFWRCSRRAARCSLVDADGRERWGVERDGRAWSWAFGDFDGDGALEIAVADRSTGPISLYDGAGVRRWIAGESVSIDRLGAADVDGDGRPDLLALANDRLTVLDEFGRVKGRRKLALTKHTATFTVAPCADPRGRATLLASIKGGFTWLDVDGRLLVKLDGRFVASPRAAPIHHPDGTRLCAILGALLVRDRTSGAIRRRGRLQVYTPRGDLVYDEVFDHTADAIALVDDGDELWVGEASRVWRYRWREDAGPSS
jgi:hypothetical protein